MPEWLKLLMVFISGALTTALGMYIALFGKIKDMEKANEMLKGRLDSFADHLEAVEERFNERMFRVQEAAAAVLRLGEKVLEQNTIVIAEMRADRKGRPHG